MNVNFKFLRPTQIILVIVLAAVVTTGCDRPGPIGLADRGANPSNKNDEIARVQTVVIKPQDLAQTIQLPGSIEGFETADLYAKVGGFLESINVEIGDMVEKKQVLAELAIPEMGKELAQKEALISTAKSDVKQAAAAVLQSESHIAQAEAMIDEAKMKLNEKNSQLQFRQTEFDRTQGLVQRGTLNSQLLDEAKFQKNAAQSGRSAMQAGVRTAEAGLEAAKADVDKAKADHERALAYVDLAQADYEHTQAMANYGTIRAPFSGVITRRMVDPGSFIQPADGNSAAKPLLTVARIDKVRIGLDLPMGQVRYLDKGDKVVLDRIDVLPGVSVDGTISRFSTMLDRDSRMMRVEIDLDNPQQQLMPGYYGYVTIYLDEFKQTPVVPSSALIAQGSDRFVFVVKDGKCEKRSITTNFQDGAIVGVATGLKAGEEVVKSGGGQLADGQQVIAVSDAK